MKKSGESYSDVAVLYRMNAQSRVMEEMLVRAGLPYRIYGGTRFYDRREVKDIVAYLRTIVNPTDNVSLARIINTPRRAIGDATIAELNRSAAEKGVPLFMAMLEPPQTLASRARKSVSEFASMMTNFMALREQMGLTEFVEMLLSETKLEEQYKREDSDEARARVENIREFVGAVSEFVGKAEDPTLEAFLENIALVTDLDNMPETARAISLMTLHSAKGLEFDNVFIIGMEQGVFPSHLALSEQRIEEERRLAYVGVTRARKQLYLSYASQRMLYNQVQHNAVSQFIEEIPRRLVDEGLSRRNRPIANPAVRTRE